jgi:hypothetical protein
VGVKKIQGIGPVGGLLGWQLSLVMTSLEAQLMGQRKGAESPQFPFRLLSVYLAAGATGAVVSTFFVALAL